MSDISIPTPRTDAAEKELRPHFGGVVRYIFAQELERELADAKREIDELSRSIRQQQLIDEEILGLRERIRRLTAAGDAIVENGSVSERLFVQWTQAKEAKP